MPTRSGRKALAGKERPSYCKRLLTSKEPCKCWYCTTLCLNIQKQKKEWRLANPEIALAAKKKKAMERDKKMTKMLSDEYVIGLLRNQTGLQSSSIPDELIEAKRQHLRLVRLIKEKRNE